MSLYAYENDIIRKLGEPRIHFALNCSALGCPILPSTPFSGKDYVSKPIPEDYAIDFIPIANCGCFGVFLARPLAWSTVIEDWVLAAVSAVCLLLVNKKL